MAILVVSIGACSSVPRGVQTFAPRPLALSIAQVGYDRSARYVYCEEGACPAPTVKTPVEAAPRTASAPVPATVQAAPSPKPPQLLEIAFAFNSSRLAQGDRDRLGKAASANRGADVEITARSDFLGSPEGKRKVVMARAKAMRSIVEGQTPGARIVERLEVAMPMRATDGSRSRQRLGTVRFTTPIAVSMKGNTK